MSFLWMSNTVSNYTSVAISSQKVSVGLEG